MTPPTVTTDLLAYNFNLDLKSGTSALAQRQPGGHMGQSLMHDLARAGDVLSIEALFDAGFDIDLADNDGRRPLHEAALCGQTETVSFLVDAGALIDAPLHPFGHTALYHAVSGGQVDVACTLLAHYANIDVTDRMTGQGLLHIAAQRGDMMMAGVLIAAGIDVLQEDHAGKTARDYAAERNHTQLEKTLLKVMQHHAVYGGI